MSELPEDGKELKTTSGLLNLKFLNKLAIINLS
jgi:hypothetical protein